MHAVSDQRKCDEREQKDQPGGVAALRDQQRQNDAARAGGRHHAERERGVLNER